jgi:hypothetical protein
MEMSIRKSLHSEGTPMPNITVAVSQESYRKARIWAARNNTSVSAAVGTLLFDLPRLVQVVSAYNSDLYADVTQPRSAHQQKTRVDTAETPQAPSESEASKAEIHSLTESVNL